MFFHTNSNSIHTERLQSSGVHDDSVVALWQKEATAFSDATALGEEKRTRFDVDEYHQIEEVLCQAWPTVNSGPGNVMERGTLSLSLHSSCCGPIYTSQRQKRRHPEIDLWKMERLCEL